VGTSRLKPLTHFEENAIGHTNTDLGLVWLISPAIQGQVDSHTTLLWCGDGRNNYNDPGLRVFFREIARRSRSTIWLTPESKTLWGSGDSDMLNSAIVQTRFQVNNLGSSPQH
jgi:uncharacterized protein with von Willebrand factor type A (vWA) domain